jgi:hypothetical protein
LAVKRAGAVGRAAPRVGAARLVGWVGRAGHPVAGADAENLADKWAAAAAARAPTAWADWAIGRGCAAATGGRAATAGWLEEQKVRVVWAVTVAAGGQQAVAAMAA